MKRFVFLIIIGAGIFAQFFISATDLYCQHPVVCYKIISPTAIKAGDSLQIVVSLDIAKGWHVYGDSKGNRKQQLQVAEVKISAMPPILQKTSIALLPAIQFKQGREIYTGEDNRFVFNLLANQDAPAGIYEIKVKINYQPCNEFQCLVPVEEEKKITVKIIE